MGSSPFNHGARGAIARHLKVLLPSSTSSNLSISDELARHWEGAGAGGTALVVSPFGGKVWRVVVGRDADGAFLGRGWPEFAAAHVFGAGWFLVLRHEAGGVLTVKAFDTTCCLREFGRPLTAANHSGSGGSRRPQFISVLLPPCMEKMGVPPKFVQKYITEREAESSVAVLLSSLCKFSRVAVEKDPSGNLFFSDGWTRFLVSHGIAEYDALLLRHEGNMVFKVKVFGSDGCQKGFKEQDRNSEQFEPSGRSRPAYQDIKTEKEEPPSCRRKRKSTAKKPDGEANSKRPRRRCTTSSEKALSSANRCVYEIGPPSWMKREMSAYILLNHMTVAAAFCKGIGLERTSEITLRMTADEVHGLRSWQVRILVYENHGTGQITRGWRRFCADNDIKEGDTCTFNVVETTLWHVHVTRRD